MASDTIKKVIDWAISIPYEKPTTKWGNPNYDCASLVINAWDNFNVPVKEKGATYTGNMKEAFLETGKFEWISYDEENVLKKGDILLNESSTTEIYIGNKLSISVDKKGKVIVSSNTKSYDGILRYID